MTAHLDTRAEADSDSTLVRGAMRLDAILVGALGIPFVAVSGMLADWTGIPRPWVLGIGVFFLAYGVVVYKLAAAEQVKPGALATIAANELCTVAAIAVVALGVWPLTGLGIAALLFSAAYTAVFAIAQYLGVRRLA
ncbi:hypothetical protein [Mycolicibacterium brumae]|uniref:Uncharacterized protein n=1 Tax=Mycolicibacterium brumae TaxID=85968 RepID=A0A2G5PFI0_9MYCO|nr:hypothetical protein [Mycolicibacterium brumae]MCV7192002.1 hypothetical protein [Mycolicibacterium brumae]PIB76793.1 hypothetical protein CQY22_003855 [Mycolicibacterium brumae]RWA20672.1 hypothetical protein MBRU_03155 [Mycolicibacterium brumae DSM 44177]UWW07768.1 hypothetical protein L2Z93_000801 [Mycolicibacterium brumae]